MSHSLYVLGKSHNIRCTRKKSKIILFWLCNLLTLLKLKSRRKRISEGINIKTILAAVPQAVWATVPIETLTPKHEHMLATKGSTRGVSLALVENDEGETATEVRFNICASKEDVVLAVELVAALMVLGNGYSMNEDGEYFESTKALRERYNSDFVESYVAWGPSALVEGTENAGDDETVNLMGPWTDVNLRVGNIRAWQKSGVLVESVLDTLTKAQQEGEEARSAIIRKDIGMLRSLLTDPHTLAVITGTLEMYFYNLDENVAMKALSNLRGLHEIIKPSLGQIAARELLLAAGMSKDDSYEGRELTTAIYEVAHRHASAGFSFAQEVSDMAYEQMKANKFPACLGSLRLCRLPSTP